MEREYIYIFKGDDTNWNNERFVTVNVNAQTGVDLSDMTAKFMLGSYTKEYPLITGSFTIDLSAAITGQYAFGPICGTIQILDSEGRIKTACNTIPFYITDKVIAEQHQTLDIDLPQGSSVSINLSVGRTVSYNDLTDKPSLNGVTIESAKTSADYGLQPAGDYATQTQLEERLATKQDVISDLAQIRSNSNLGATAVQHGTLDTALATKQDKLNSSQLAAVNSGIDTDKVGQIATNAEDINSIQGKIPSQASSSNQLADKAFVNSTVATNTANFIGTFNSLAELEAYTGTLTNNDYAFVVTTDQAGNTLYDRYKYNGASWLFEYKLNNSSFTAAQWAAIQSGITATLVAQIGTNRENIANLGSTKQDTISDLSTIRAGAQAGATALQPATAAQTYVPLSQKGVAAGVASLDNSGKVSDGQIPYATATKVGGIKQTFDATTGVWTVITEDL